MPNTEKAEEAKGIQAEKKEFLTFDGECRGLTRFRTFTVTYIQQIEHNRRYFLWFKRPDWVQKLSRVHAEHI